jgi:hypothetical protein
MSRLQVWATGLIISMNSITLVRKLCELGCLFRKVRGFISDNISRSPSYAATEVGTVTQAFCSALQEELSDYYKLLAVLESYSLNPIPTPGSPRSPRSTCTRWSSLEPSPCMLPLIFLFHSNRFVVIYAMQDGQHVQDMLKVRLQFKMCIYFLGLNLFNLNRLFFIQSKFPMTCHIISIRGFVKQLCWD